MVWNLTTAIVAAFLEQFVHGSGLSQGYLKIIDFGIARRITNTRYGPLKVCRRAFCVHDVDHFC